MGPKLYDHRGQDDLILFSCFGETLRISGVDTIARIGCQC